MRLDRPILTIKKILEKKNWRVPKLGVVIFCLTVLAFAITYNVVGDRTVWGAWISVVPSIIWVGLLLPTAIRLRRWLLGSWGWGPTAPAFLPLSRLDQVWVSNDVELVSVRVRPLAGSDHRGLIVDFLL